MRESNRCNGLEHVPACSTWPPPWLRQAVQLAPKPPPAVSPSDLTPGLRERWEERVAIMEYDGGLSLKEAEAAALADVLRQAEAPADKGNAVGNAGPKQEDAKAEEAAAAVQATLFAEGGAGPYRRW